MKHNPVFGFIVALLLVACNNDEDSTVTFPYTLKAQELRVEQNVKMYIGGVEITDKKTIDRFLKQESELFSPEEILSGQENVTLTFLNNEVAVIDGTKDTLEVVVNGNEFTYLMRVSSSGVTLPSLGNFYSFTTLKEPERYLKKMVGWGDYSKMKIYCASYKWVCEFSSSGSWDEGTGEEGDRVLHDRWKKIDRWEKTGEGIFGDKRMFTFCGVTYLPVNKDDLATMKTTDTLAIKEYSWIFR